MKFAEALAKTREEDAKLTERVMAVGQLTVEPDGLYAAGERLNFGPKGFDQLCDRFRHKVPADYLRSLPTPVALPLLRHHLNGGIEGGDTIALYMRGEEVNGIGRTDLVRLPGTDVMEAVLDGMGGSADELKFTRLAFGDESVRFDVVTQRAERGQARGHRVRGCQRVSFLDRRVCDKGGRPPPSAAVPERGDQQGMR